MERILEPELMDDAAQALAYARADFADVNRGFVDRFRTMFPDLAETYAGGESPLLKRDFYNSLRAAFTPAEVARQLARQLPQLSCRVVSDRHWVVTGRLP